MSLGELPTRYVRTFEAGGKSVRSDYYNPPPDVASYIIYKEGGLIKAKNGRTGQVEFSGTDATTVRQQVVNALPEGCGLVVEKIGKIIYTFYKNKQVVLKFDGNGNIIYFHAGGPASPIQKRIFQERVEFSYLSRMDNISEWSVAGTADTDTEVKIEGEASIKITATNLGFSSIEKDVSLDLTGKHLQLWLKTEDYTKVRAIYIMLRTSVDWTDYYFLNPAWPPSTAIQHLLNEGITLDLNEAAMGKHGSPSWSDIKGVRIRLLAEENVTASIWVDDFRIVQNKYKGLITFRFDDAYEDVYTLAKPKLDKYGYKGVVAVIGGQIGSSGKLTLSQLSELHQWGWDIVPHGFRSDHAHYDTLTHEEIEEDLINALMFNIENGFYNGMFFFIPPGHVIPDAETFKLIKKYYAACQWLTGWKFNSIPPPDPYALQSISAPNKSLDELKSFVDLAESTGTWITFYVHAAADWGTKLDDLLDYISTKNVAVVTFSDVFNKLNLPSALSNSGIATFSGDGVTTTFNIPHGLISTPTKYGVSPLTPDADAPRTITAGSTNITITYSAAPPSGVDNLKFGWWAKV